VIPNFSKAIIFLDRGLKFDLFVGYSGKAFLEGLHVQQKVSIHVLDIVSCKNLANRKLVEIFTPEIAKS